jgi:hypothetical protein
MIRLKAYQKVQERIFFYENESVFAQCFPELVYFNYAYKKDGNCLTPNEIQDIQAFYLSHGIKHFQFFTPNEEPQLILLGAKVKSTFVKQEYLTKRLLTMPGTSEFSRVNETSIDDFTKTYLASFEAGPKIIEDVCRNFRQLLWVPNLEMYLIKEGGVSVGVLVAFVHQNKALLAGGAVLPDYRNRYNHRDGIAFRVNKFLQDSNVQNIETWTYLGSQSYQNMLASGFANSKTYYLYAFD